MTSFPFLYNDFEEKCFLVVPLRLNNFVYSGMVGVFYLIFYCIGSIIFGLLIYRIINYSKHCKNNYLLKLQWMLFRAITVQIVIELLFLITPTFGIILTYYFQLKNGEKITVICLTLTSLHAWLDFMCLLYFVRPYRNRLKLIFKELFNIKVSNLKIPNTTTSHIGVRSPSESVFVT